VCGGVIINVDVWRGLEFPHPRGRSCELRRRRFVAGRPGRLTHAARGRNTGGSGAGVTLDAATRRRDTTGTTLCILVLALPHTTPAANPILAKDQDQDTAAAPAEVNSATHSDMGGGGGLF